MNAGAAAYNATYADCLAKGWDHGAAMHEADKARDRAARKEAKVSEEQKPYGDAVERAAATFRETLKDGLAGWTPPAPEQPPMSPERFRQEVLLIAWGKMLPDKASRSYEDDAGRAIWAAETFLTVLERSRG